MHLLLVKCLHILGAVLFLGTGLGSAYYKFRAWRSGDPVVAAWCDAEVVRADWLFTVPSGVLMPVSGLYLARAYGMDWTAPWVLSALVGWALAGVFWLPAAVLQIRMRRLAAEAVARGELLPLAYHSMQRTWALLGLPSFSVTLWTVWIMVSKRPFPG